MVDKASNTYPTATTASYVYAEDSTGAFVRFPTSGLVLPTGAATGDIFYASAADTVSRLAIGSSGQSLIVSGGVPAWGSTSTVTLIQRQTASAAATVSFTTGISTAYDEFFFVFSDVYPSTNATNVILTISEDGGTSYRSSSYVYSDVGVTFSGTAVASNSGSTGTSSWVLAKAVGNAAANAACGVVRIYPRTANCSFTSLLGYKGTTATNYPLTSAIAGQIATTTRANAFRLAAASGNINGTIGLYGVKNS